MRTPVVVALVAALGLAALPAGAASSPSAETSASSPQLKVRTGALGRFLVDGSGRTLYLFTPDSRTKSACTGSCAKEWPPFVAAGKARAGSGVSASRIGSIKRGTTRQVTYAGHPLYRYADDGNQPGRTRGQGEHGVWWLLSPNGKRISATKPSTAPTATSPYPGSGY